MGVKQRRFVISIQNGRHCHQPGAADKQIYLSVWGALVVVDVVVSSRQSFLLRLSGCLFVCLPACLLV